MSNVLCNHNFWFKSSGRVRSRAAEREKDAVKAPPKKEAPEPAPREIKKVEKRSTSNVFTMFSQAQIQEFKEVKRTLKI